MIKFATEPSKGAIQGWYTGNIPLSLGAALRAQNQDAGGGLALALSQRDFQRRNGRGA